MSFDTPNPESLSMTRPGGDCLSIGEDEGAGEKEDKDAEDAEDFQPQNMRDVGFRNTCESLIHPSIIVQACILSEQNSDRRGLSKVLAAASRGTTTKSEHVLSESYRLRT